jgi:beclin
MTITAPSAVTAITNTSNDVVPAARVPWSEINAALGHVVLLLSILVERCGWSMTHELVPLASTSQIGVRRFAKTLFGTTTNQLQPPIFCNLYFEESSFSLFKGGAMRQFQLGLVALLECFVEITQSDKTIVLPHAITLAEDITTTTTTNGSTGTMIGGIPFVVGGDDGELFTRACKYLLTNLKWLVAYAVKHHMA